MPLQSPTDPLLEADVRRSSLLTSLLTVLLCCHFSSSVTFAAVRASGLMCTASGASSVSSSDGRMLEVTNIGSSGQDGVDISLSSLSRHAMRSSSSWSSTDDGAVLSFSWGMSVSGSPPGSSGHGMLDLQRLGGDVLVHSDLSELTNSSDMRCLVYLSNALVADITMPVLSSFTLTPSPGSSVIPEVSLELDSSRGRALSSVSMSSSSVFLFGGQSLDCDRVVTVVDLDRDGALDVCVARCTIPPTSSLSSITFESMSTGRFSFAMSSSDLDLDGSSESLSLSLPSLATVGSLSLSSSLSSRMFPPSSGSGGGGGGGSSVTTLPAHGTLQQYSPAPMMSFSSSNPFVINPSTDAGASLEYTVSGTGTCSPTGEVAALRLVVASPSALSLQTRFSGMCADQESVIVVRRGLEVARFAVTVDGTIGVTSPPGGSPVTPVCQQGKSTQVTRSNISNNLTGSTGDGEAGGSGAGGVSPPEFSSVVGPEGVTLQMSFLADRVFCHDGTCVTGDEIRVQGRCTSGACSPVSITGSNLLLGRASSGSGGSSLHLSNASPTGEDLVSAYIPSSVAISSHTPVVQVPVILSRENTQAMRATSVTFSLSSNLVLASPVVESDYFSSLGTSQMFVVDNGNNSYTVDCALLGPGCGPTGSGTLFVLSLARAPGAPDGTGFVSVDASQAAACDAAPLPAAPGGQTFIVLDSSAPTPPATFTVEQKLSGNDGDGTTAFVITWSTPPAGETVELYRASFGNYPEYDDAPGAGSEPPAPSYPPSGRWTRVTPSCPSIDVAVSTCGDEPSSRDVYTFVVYGVDVYGNASPSSSMSVGTLNYHLGDVSDGLVECTGDNQVTASDISALGAHYGATVPNGSAFACLDVGPTFSGGVSGRPATDNRVAFDDLVLFAINFSLVSSPASEGQVAAATSNQLRVTTPSLPAVGSTFDAIVEMEGAGDVQALSTQLGWDASVVEPVDVSKGALFALQGRDGVVLSSAPGNVDAALLGAGAGLAGRGELARVTFRVKGTGDPAIRISGVSARNSQNQEVAIAGATAIGGGSPGTALRMAFPNPFDRSTAVVLSLAQAGEAEVGVFDVAGRHVRTLHSGLLSAGQHTLHWDGRDDSGQRLGAGVYMLRFEAGGRSETRALRIVR